MAESRALIREYQAGNEAALGELIERYAGRVERIVRARMGAFLRSQMDVEDVMQQVFVRVVRDIGSLELREDAGLIQWLARLAENELMNQARFQKAQRRDARREQALARLAESGLATSMAFDLSSEEPRVTSQVANREMELVLDGCIGALDEGYREVILLRNHAGGSWEWIAGQLDKPSADAARKFHARAMIELTELMQGVV
jgi:RNA polymerase sigma-70 factor (ECF subfamily)